MKESFSDKLLKHSLTVFILLIEAYLVYMLFSVPFADFGEKSSTLFVVLAILIYLRVMLTRAFKNDKLKSRKEVTTNWREQSEN